jgi:hypothetical protein
LDYDNRIKEAEAVEEFSTQEKKKIKKVQTGFVPCLIKHHAVKTYWEVEAQFHAFLTSTIYMEVRGWIPTTVGISQEKDALVLTG